MEREGEDGGKLREEKQRKEQYTRRVNSNLPWEYCQGERKSIAFYKQGEITPLLQKAIQEKKKQRKEHNFRKNPQKEKPF